MLNLNCLSCGALISAEENAESCVCENCSNTWKIIELTEYKQKVQDIKAKVMQDFENQKKEAEEARARKKADEDRQKQTEAYIAKRKADAELERAKNEGKPKTVVVNGPNIPEILDNAVSAFAAGDFSSACNGANEVLACDAKNLSAGFIIAFHEEVLKKRVRQLDPFFEGLPTLPGAIPAEELGRLCRLFTAGASRLAVYEAQILAFVYANGNDLGPAEVRKFVDGFSPRIIATRTNGSFLTGALLKAYMDLSAFCSIPQTCFTLLGAIESNPDSPLKTGEYYLTGKSKKFFENFVIPTGKIIDAMRSEKNRPQFQKAFADKSAVYRQKAGI